MKLTKHLIGGAILSLCLALGSCKDTKVSSDTSTKRVTNNDRLPNQYQTQTLSNIAFGWDIRFSANKAAIITKNSNGFSLKYVGPNAKSNTELTDGYFINVTLAKAKSILDYTESINALGTDKQHRVGDYKATVFKTRSALNDELVTHYAYTIQSNSNIIVDISINTYGEDKKDYNMQVQRFVDSITWINSTK